MTSLPLAPAISLYLAWAECERRVKAMQREMTRKAGEQARPGVSAAEREHLDALRKLSTRMLQEWIREMEGRAQALQWEVIERTPRRMGQGTLSVRPEQGPDGGSRPMPSPSESLELAGPAATASPP
jgi:hypothetical protein